MKNSPALSKPVLVTRDVTERQEGVDAGTARLVGANTERAAAAMRELLDDRAWSYDAPATCQSASRYTP